MPLSKSLLSFLNKNGIKYEPIEHRTVFTAFDKAATLKVKPEIVAKTVLVSLDKKSYALAMIPANKNLDKKKLLDFINKTNKKTGKNAFKKIEFADEKWMKKNLKGIKVGSTPPFGEFFKIPAFIDRILARQSKIFAGAGDYENSLKISPLALFKADKNLIKGNFSQTKK
ncbi:MAG: YbaK/EbsC family protein [Candidatus Portnoybacteria bacterium]|nr:YbaK/EbsC family protein [Candidatus Portnoybacteria bacterium]